MGLKISKHDKTNTTGEDISYDIDLLEDHEEYYLGGVHDVLLGLGEEAGEVQGKVKKLVRDKAFSKSDIIKELGDCLFYVTAIANYLGSNLQEVANINLNKLHDRQKRNKLQGSGDDR